MLLQLAGIVAVLLSDRHRLSRPGLASAGVARPGKHPGRRALGGHSVHRREDRLHVLGAIPQGFGLLVGQRMALTGHHILGGNGQARAVLHPAVGQRGHGVRQLQHREVVVALADAQRDGFAGVPLLLLRPLVGIALPFLTGQHAPHLALEVDARDLPEAQGLHEVVHGVHPHLVGQGVVVGVARLDDAAPHVDRTQPVVTVTAEAVVAEHPEARVVDDGRGLAGTRLQGRQCHEGLVGGAGRVGAAQRTVEQRLVDRLVQCLPVLDVDALDKEIGVEGGLGDKGQHLAIARVDGHQGATALAEHRLDQVLQLDVDGQHHRVARRGGLVGQRPHRAPPGRGLDPLEAGDAMQLTFIALLGPQLADVFGTPVVGLLLIGPVVHDLLFPLVDATDVADHMAGRLTVGILPKEAGPDVHAGKPVALHGKAGHLFVREAGAQGQRIKAP